MKTDKSLNESIRNMSDNQLNKFYETIVAESAKTTAIALSSLKEATEKNSYHIEIINTEMGQLVKQQEATTLALNDLCRNVIELKTDISWLKKFFFIVATTSIGGLIMGMFNLIIKK